jgi:hypothetical protein
VICVVRCTTAARRQQHAGMTADTVNIERTSQRPQEPDISVVSKMKQLECREPAAAMMNSPAGEAVLSECCGTATGNSQLE